MKPLQAGITLLHIKHYGIGIAINAYCINWEIEMCEMMWTVNTLRMVCIIFVLLIIPSNLYLCVIVREDDGKRIEERYNIITLLHIEGYYYLYLCVTMAINFIR